jgi:hypothetical protein
MVQPGGTSLVPRSELPAMTDDPIPHDTEDQEEESPPELADWWVWGVRRIAAPIADLLLAARVLPLLFLLLKGAT